MRKIPQMLLMTVSLIMMQQNVFADAERAGGVDVAKIVGKLRTYCAACHALGTLRFIHSDDDEKVWTYIRTQKVPGKTYLWKDEIIRVLSWPTNSPPPASEPMDPVNRRDWMPMGFKRVELADDVDNEGKSVRKEIIEALMHSQKI